ncbi:hypothetical protein CEUSTIGMA_g13959.t1 [Chlamydomonas eustigma]|uniref:Gamma-tubulin complex component n=1 Tax=Chlamydomonas eustigma TaxID=1157962 RepID=A0A250XUF6_9CHLO|nr:hypothetical protein CEUSTIGMA_g13959.t1 [Chlamydomonas eustigma]|eukprot:GAX86552.1 hypothetical protein CEUSTIGMA_g13959.t1 [Chlamydomonas eustigma]
MQSPHLTSTSTFRSSYPLTICALAEHQHPGRVQGPTMMQHVGSACQGGKPGVGLGSVQHQPHLHQLSWLLEGLTDVDPPPVDVLLEQCLIPLLKLKVNEINGRLLKSLLSDWGLISELSKLRNFYFMASPTMQAWSASLLTSLLRGRTLEDYLEHELESMLQEAALSSHPDHEALPPLEYVSVVIDYKRVARAREKQVEATRKTAVAAGTSVTAPDQRQNHCVAELEGLQLRYQPSWLMTMMGGPRSMDSYCQVQVFLLQIQLAKLALDSTRQRCQKLFQLHSKSHAVISLVTMRGAAGGTNSSYSDGMDVLGVLYGGQEEASRQLPKASTARSGKKLDASDERLALQEMMNFVNNLHQAVLDRLLLNSWVQLERGLHLAKSLDEVVALHQSFVQAMDQQCGRGGGDSGSGTHRHVWAAITRVLDQTVRFCSAQKTAAEAAEALSMSYSIPQSGASGVLAGGLSQRSHAHLKDQITAAREIMSDAAAQFRQLLLYLLRILRAASIKGRSRAEFQLMLSRINHNGFYNKALEMNIAE